MNTLVLFLALAAADPDAAAPAVSDAPLYDRGSRLRFGASAQGGWRTFASAFVLELEMRAGFQATPQWSIFGLLKGSMATSGLISPVVIIGALVEAMLTNHFYFAVGPLLAYGSFSGLDDAAVAFPRLYSEAAGGSVKPGFDVRLGVATARSKPPSFNRFGMSIGLELTGLYHWDLVSTSGFGGVMPTPVSPWWVFTPMVSIGIDTR